MSVTKYELNLNMGKLDVFLISFYKRINEIPEFQKNLSGTN